MRQSIRRLAKDLQIDGTNSREWRILPNPSGTTGVSDIRAGIQEWLTPGLPPSRKRTALIVVMKNKKRLENLAVAEHYLSPTAGKNRLMMVHPSQTTNNHQVYFDWVTAVKDVWDRLLRKPATDPDRQQLLGAFSKSYASLTDTGSAAYPEQVLGPTRSAGGVVVPDNCAIHKGEGLAEGHHCVDDG